MKIRIATRGSHLALAQTYFVEKKIRNLGIDTEIIIIKTTGDINYSSFEELAKKGDETKGLFTKEIEESLLNKEADIAVHSLKDLPTRIPEDLMIACLPERLDFRDYWIFPKNKKIQETFPYVKKGAIIGTSSMRRKSIIKYYMPDSKFVPLRGNVPTRIRKIFSDNLDAILLSGAGIQRLSLEKNWIDEHYLKEIEVVPLDPEFFPNAPGQGTIAVECRKKDYQIIEILKKIHDSKIEDLINIERGILKNLEGGCHLPLGVHSEKKNGVYYAVIFLGKDYPYGKKNKDIFIKRFHKDPDKLVEFVSFELINYFPVVVMGNKNKNQILKLKFPEISFFDILDIKYYDQIIKKIINKNDKLKIKTVYTIFSSEGIRALKKLKFDFNQKDEFYIILNGKKSKEVFVKNFPEVYQKQIFLSEDGTAQGIFKVIDKNFDLQSLKIIAVTGKLTSDVFFDLVISHSVECENWIVYESFTNSLMKQEIESIPHNAVIIFGSPSIFDAFENSLKIHNLSFSENWKVVTLGETTFQHIYQKGYSVYAKSREPDYEMIIKEFIDKLNL